MVEEDACELKQVFDKTGKWYSDSRNRIGKKNKLQE